MNRIAISRRAMLKGFASGVLGVCTLPALSTLLARRAQAEEGRPHYFVFAYFSGGWDQLLLFDPRDGTQARFRAQQAYATNGSGIDVAYERLTDSVTKGLLAANPSGVVKPSGSNLTFGAAVPTSLLDHAQDLSVVRGINMETLTHEVGRRYFITGQFPRGLQAAGSALPTAVAGQMADGAALPHLTMGVESYNASFPSYASGVQALQPSDVSRALRRLGDPLPTAADEAVARYEAEADGCETQELDGDGLASIFRSSRLKQRSIIAAGLSSRFNFTFDTAQQTKEIKDLFKAFAIARAADLFGPVGQAALAAQVITTGVSRAVSLLLGNNLDHHDSEWTREHAPKLRAGLDALARLISYLKNSPHSDGGSYWDYTTVVAFSEFSRSPLVNGRGGRDHHLASSCLLAGAGIRGNVVVGGTSDQGMLVESVNPMTGALDAGGIAVRPADVHATVLAAMGLSDAHLAGQSPRKLTALLRGT
jgi:uncharacterized protein (DUF1501 family)